MGRYLARTSGHRRSIQMTPEQIQQARDLLKAADSYRGMSYVSRLISVGKTPRLQAFLDGAGTLEEAEVQRILNSAPVLGRLARREPRRR